MGKKSVAISNDIHKKLISIKSTLDNRYKKIHSMNDVIAFLIGVFHDE